MIGGYHEGSSPLAALLATGSHPGLGPGLVQDVLTYPRAVEDRTGARSIGTSLRRYYTDITPESFHRQGRIQDADGNWRLEQDMRARRRPEAS
ncbi:hypothetical protein [Glycomyces sp. YM15]|uniref:hypothetical protein n=1 Tax=Glycomyces sp. YM15 TaxID=2800446 RepID=UPI001962FB57|nr:hypothetical protein [Glycomyces sp. YM15]